MREYLEALVTTPASLGVLPLTSSPRLDAVAPRTSALDGLLALARNGSPLEQGQALRTLDGLGGYDTALSLVGAPEANMAQPAVLASDQPFAIVQVQDRRGAGRIDLREHEGRGTPPSHTISMHVGKSRAFLLGMMQPVSGRLFSVYKVAHSTFPSLEAANALVSATLSRGTEIEPGVFYREFSSPTGVTAVRRDVNFLIRPQGRVDFETSYGVVVVTRPDSGMPGGFRVQTAYPTTPYGTR